MKMPEPIGYLSQYNLMMLEQGYPQTIVMLKGVKRDLPVYDKQALIDLLEAASKEMEKMAAVEVQPMYYYVAAKKLRSMKETL
jgi:hypothetical protein